VLKLGGNSIARFSLLRTPLLLTQYALLLHTMQVYFDLSSAAAAAAVVPPALHSTTDNNADSTDTEQQHQQQQWPCMAQPHAGIAGVAAASWRLELPDVLSVLLAPSASGKIARFAAAETHGAWVCLEEQQMATLLTGWLTALTAQGQFGAWLEGVKAVSDLPY
jgi:hypothetical protein